MKLIGTPSFTDTQTLNRSRKSLIMLHAPALKLISTTGNVSMCVCLPCACAEGGESWPQLLITVRGVKSLFFFPCLIMLLPKICIIFAFIKEGQCLLINSFLGFYELKAAAGLQRKLSWQSAGVSRLPPVQPNRKKQFLH